MLRFQRWSSPLFPTDPLAVTANAPDGAAVVTGRSAGYLRAGAPSAGAGPVLPSSQCSCCISPMNVAVSSANTYACNAATRVSKSIREAITTAVTPPISQLPK